MLVLQGKKEQIKSKARRKEIIKIRVKINETDNRTSIEKINKINNWFFEKISKINTPLARLTKKRRQETKMLQSFRNEIGVITTDAMDIKRIIQEYY